MLSRTKFNQGYICHYILLNSVLDINDRTKDIILAGQQNSN